MPPPAIETRRFAVVVNCLTRFEAQIQALEKDARSAAREAEQAQLEAKLAREHAESEHESSQARDAAIRRLREENAGVQAAADEAKAEITRLSGALRASREQMAALMRSESETVSDKIATAVEVGKSWELQREKFERDMQAMAQELEVCVVCRVDVSCAMCHVPCAVCRVSCVMCRVSCICDSVSVYVTVVCVIETCGVSVFSRWCCCRAGVSTSRPAVARGAGEERGVGAGPGRRASGQQPCHRRPGASGGAARRCPLPGAAASARARGRIAEAAA